MAFLLPHEMKRIEEKRSDGIGSKRKNGFWLEQLWPLPRYGRGFWMVIDEEKGINYESHD